MHGATNHSSFLLAGDCVEGAERGRWVGMRPCWKCVDRMTMVSVTVKGGDGELATSWRRRRLQLQEVMMLMLRFGHAELPNRGLRSD